MFRGKKNRACRCFSVPMVEKRRGASEDFRAIGRCEKKREGVQAKRAKLARKRRLIGHQLASYPLKKSRPRCPFHNSREKKKGGSGDSWGKTLVPEGSRPYLYQRPIKKTLLARPGGKKKGKRSDPSLAQEEEKKGGN